MRSYIGFVVVFLVSCPAWADEGPRPPGALPPQVCLASAAEKEGTVKLKVSVPRMVPYHVTRVLEVRDGKQVTKTFTRYKAVMEETTLSADDKAVKVTRKDGRSVKPGDLPKLLGKESRVLVFSRVEDFDEIDPYYLGIIDERVLIITVPPGKVYTPEPKERDEISK
jgi:hypothetical protein